MKILIINGPNLNMLGRREPELYGNKSMEQVMLDIQRQWMDVHFVYRQSNHEGDIIDWLQETVTSEDIAGIVLNAGGYTHTSVAIRDAISLCSVPVVEVHISNIYAREPFRQVSLLTDVCAHTIIGQGTDGYAQAVAWILREKR